MKVYLKYSFIFDPADAWGNIAEFDNDLLSYFRGMGFDAETIRAQNPSDGDIMIYLDKTIDLAPLDTTSRRQSLPQQMAQQTLKRGFDGKFKKPNGA